MMPAIKIRNLSKHYRIKGPKKKEQFEALRNINLDIEKGKVTGLIGPNGAGKSTLLKILSRITLPSTGTIEIEGRLASLLEVGTGFNQELSGRENIYLNGAILGMSTAEIDAQFDEILAFSGVNKFIDTPVKHYSSGMYVRLAFSVAAHLQSDILLIDEVLAVGDANFQKKCLEKINEATQANRTVVFVSHNMSIARTLCDTLVYLKKGEVVKKGNSDEVADFYLKESTEVAKKVAVSDRIDRKGNGQATLQDLSCHHQNMNGVLTTGLSANFVSCLQINTTHQEVDVELRLNIFNTHGQFLTTLNNKLSGHLFKTEKSEVSLNCSIKKLPLMPGSYTIKAKVNVNGIQADVLDNAYTFKVLEGDFYGSKQWDKKRVPGVFIDQHWGIEA